MRLRRAYNAHAERAVRRCGSRRVFRSTRHGAPRRARCDACHGRHDRFELQSGAVDAVVSFYALGHVPADRHAALLRSIARWLRPDGLVMMSTPAGPGDGVDPDWHGGPMFFAGLDEGSTRTGISKAGLRLERLERINESEADGDIVEFLWITATKSSAG
ncbi:MAG: methyltransferase domain-containing protein [Nitriliruptorales bacterium]|nr:methyltransferase domain-containing protein [Nitriliruptorales bacterium]